MFICKNENFQKKTFDVFLIFARNIDCGYTLEPTASVPGPSILASSIAATRQSEDILHTVVLLLSLFFLSTNLD